MQTKLDKLLDGPVAERFGRPTDRGDYLALVHDEWLWTKDGSYRTSTFAMRDTTAAALWLSHLLAVAIRRGWVVEMWDDGPELGIAARIEHIAKKYEQYGSGRGLTALEALAVAMLEVPEPNQ